MGGKKKETCYHFVNVLRIKYMELQASFHRESVVYSSLLLGGKKKKSKIPQFCIRNPRTKKSF
jgi:hypothetical protein